MIHLKRISVLFIALLVAFLAIGGPIAAEAKTLAAGTASGAIAETVSVPITIDDPTGVGGIAFTLTYDPSVLEFAGLQQTVKVIADGSASYTTDQLRNNLFYQWNDEGAPSTRTGRAMVAAATAQALTGTNLALFNARFTIKGGNGAYPINVVRTIIQNASAGYATPTQLPVLVGTTTPNGSGMYTETNFPVYAATLVAGSVTVNAPKYTISGSVVYGSNPTTPATGATVVLKRNSSAGWVFDAQTTVGATGGAYSFANKPAGTYQVFVTSNDPNYANGQSASFDVTSANVTVPQITLAAPQPLVGDAGAVALNGGSVVSGLQVRVMNGTTVVGIYAVNADGSFQTPALPVGSYTVFAVYGKLSAPMTQTGGKWSLTSAWNETLRSIGGNIAGLTGSATVMASSVKAKLQKTVTKTGSGAYPDIAYLIPENDYIVSVAAAGQPVKYFKTGTGGTTDINQATAVDITSANKTDANFDFTGVTSGTIGGTITEASAPVASIGVYAFETNTFALTQVTTNPSGVYSFTLPAGRYEIFVIKANNKIFYFKDGPAPVTSTQSEAEATKIDLVAGVPQSGKDINITECTNILAGKVTFRRADGDPAANVLITATSSGGNGIAMTGANGAYSIGGLCGPYDYRVEMNPLDSRYAVQSATVQIPTTVPQNFVIGTGNVLSGEINESGATGTKIGNAMIYLLDQQTGTLVNGRMYFSGADGAYTIADIPNGIDTLSVTHPSYRAYSEPNLSITADITGKNISLVKGAYFDVTVYDTVSPTPLRDALVIVTRAGAVPVYALTDANGNCRIYGLETTGGNYTILAQKAGFERLSQSAPATSNGLPLITFTLNRPALRFDLSGTITSSCGGAIQGAYVLVSTGDFFVSTITNASGVYSFVDLPQGSGYRFVVVPGGALKTHLETGLTFGAAPPAKNVEITCGSEIKGNVTRTSGSTPIFVFLYTLENQFVGFTEANATTGAYTFTGLVNTTTYKVLAVSSGFGPKWYNGQTTIGTASPVSAGGTGVDIVLEAVP